jgi:O-antigen ligase
VYWFVNNIERIAVEVFQKEQSFGGRDDLKNVLWNIFFWEKPWFGHGYFGFWDLNRARVMAEVEKIQSHNGNPWVSHSHSGFLDIGLYLGIVGLTIFAINFIFNYFTSINYLILERTPQSFWPFLFMTLFAIFNINNAMTILSSEHLLWALYVSTVIKLRHWSQKRII